MAIISTQLVEVARKIRDLYPTLDYDHRPFIVPDDTSYEIKMKEEFRRGYACFKYAIASIIQPKTICEIGVGSGIAASAFLSACPESHYTGIDNLHDEKICNYPFIEKITERFNEKKYSFNFHIIDDSMNLNSLPDPVQYDLVHVDGHHGSHYAYHDTLLAMKSNSKWILIDDCRDTQVACSAMLAAYNIQAGSLEWAYFEDTWTGSILISREKPH